MIHGHLDPSYDHQLRGWAWDPQRPYTPVEVEIWIDGALHRKIVADEYRADLFAAGIGDGWHGFRLALPESLCDDQPHTIETKPPLHGSPMVFESFLDGTVESVDESGGAVGWLRDRVHPHARGLSVRLYGDGQLVARGRTAPDSDRFHIRIPNGFDVSQVRKWSLRESIPWRDKSAVVDVIVPVYGGVAETRKAIECASRQQPVPFELIVINDNPDDVAMASALEELRVRLGFTLLRNEQNLGFVRTVNRGMALHPDRDIVLLNSDTEVPDGDWLQRLRSAIYGQAHAGTATPFSNNATICSYPRICESNPPVDFDRYCREHLSGQTVEIPTAVGFCMYIRRDCLNETGFFDAHTFGRGYGEENDFCMRARRLGWRHLLAADVFVIHHGHVSFEMAGQMAGSSAENAAKLSALHPEYDGLVADFLRRDPLAKLRRTIDIAALTPQRERVCIATNTLPGGNERYVQQLRARDPLAVVMRYRNARFVTLDAGPHFAFDLDHERDLLADTLRKLGVTRLHINQIVDAPLGIFELGIPYEVTIHDYAWICPQVTLQDETGEYCGEPHVWHCESCYRKLGPHKDWGSLLQRASSVEEMRGDNLEALRRAEWVTFPSRDIEQRMRRYFDPRQARVVPHETVVPAPRRKAAASDTVRVAYIGSLGYAKGFHVLYALALDALKRSLPLEFTVIGAAVESRPLEELGVKVLGYYQSDAEALEWIDALDPHLALFPGVLPESFSYTLSLAFQAGLYPVAYDIGAIAERIRDTGFGSLIPLGATPAEVNDLLIRLI